MRAHAEMHTHTHTHSHTYMPSSPVHTHTLEALCARRRPDGRMPGLDHFMGGAFPLLVSTQLLLSWPGSPEQITQSPDGVVNEAVESLGFRLPDVDFHVIWGHCL